MKVKRIIGYNEYKMVEIVIGSGRRTMIEHIPYNEFVKKYGNKLLEKYEKSKRR